MVSVYLYVPNLIGYARVAFAMTAFALAFKDKALFVILYFLSFACDELDGRFARLLNQTSSFGAVLDMVTDRVCTASLLFTLSHLYKEHFLLFLGLMVLDIASHWLRMYSTNLEAYQSHKNVAVGTPWPLRMYYSHRIFMGYCCVSAELVYLMLYLLHDRGYHTWPSVSLPGMAKPVYLAPTLLLIALPGCALKQLMNVLQMKLAADTCVAFDEKSKADRKKKL
eukprot:jgi/Chlat1/8597/Chrsp86S08020